MDQLEAQVNNKMDGHEKSIAKPISMVLETSELSASPTVDLTVVDSYVPTQVQSVVSASKKEPHKRKIMNMTQKHWRDTRKADYLIRREK